MDGIATLAASPVNSEVLDRLETLENNNRDLNKLVENLNKLFLESQKRITILETQLTNKSVVEPVATTQKSEPEDDGVDLFASDSEEDNTESARIREERLAAYAAKKSKKPALIAKSSLVLDVKPWDDETDLKVMEQELRKITSDGLLWGASKFVPVAFGIQKLSISCVVEDEKVSIDWLTEEIEKLEDYVQSVDVAAFNKI